MPTRLVAVDPPQKPLHVDVVSGAGGQGAAAEQKPAGEERGRGGPLHRWAALAPARGGTRWATQWTTATWTPSSVRTVIV